MISTVDVETSYQKTEHGGMDPLPFNPKNILVSVGINDEYYFFSHNHKEFGVKTNHKKVQDTLDKTKLFEYKFISRKKDKDLQIYLEILRFKK